MSLVFDADPRRQVMRPTTLDQRRDLPPPKPPRKRANSRPQSCAGSVLPPPLSNDSFVLPGLRGGAGKSSDDGEGNGGAAGGERGVRGRGAAAAAITAVEEEQEKMEDEEKEESGVSSTSMLVYICAALAVLVLAMLVYRVMHTGPAPVVAETMGSSTEISSDPSAGAGISGGSNKAGQGVSVDNVMAEGRELDRSSSMTMNPSTRTSTRIAKIVSLIQMDREQQTWIQRTATLSRP